MCSIDYVLWAGHFPFLFVVAVKGVEQFVLCGLTTIFSLQGMAPANLPSQKLPGNDAILVLYLTHTHAYIIWLAYVNKQFHCDV